MNEIGSGENILVVEDTPAMQEFLAMALETQGFAVALADDVQAALSRLEERHYDIVLADKNLPDGTGMDVARHVAECMPTCDTILITAYTDVASAIAAMRLGVADYIEKPLTLPILYDRLRRVLRSQCSSAESRRLVSELQDRNRELKDAIRRDSMTGLFNRGYFEDALARELGESTSQELELAVLFIDVDNFKRINDRFGHAVGDKLLITLGMILEGKARAPEGTFALRAHDVAARLGGDEFAVLLPKTAKVDAKNIAERLRVAVESQDFAEQGLPDATLSIGIAGYPDDATDQAGLLAASDSALYSAKHLGRNRVVSCSEPTAALDEAHGDRIGTEDALIAALDDSITDSLFDFVYKPIWCARTGQLVAQDAVVTPRHPSFPDARSLVRMAERAGRVRDLCRRLRACRVQGIGGELDGTRVFFRVHALELEDPRFWQPEAVHAASPTSVVLVLNLAAPAHSAARVCEGLRRLRAMGHGVALENIPSDYSALDTIALYEPSFVKLGAKQFRGAVADGRRARFLKRLVEFSAEEDVSIIAEGIDTPELHRLARQLECPLVQGTIFDGRELAARS